MALHEFTNTFSTVKGKHMMLKIHRVYVHEISTTCGAWSLPSESTKKVNCLHFTLIRDEWELFPKTANESLALVYNNRYFTQIKSV